MWRISSVVLAAAIAFAPAADAGLRFPRLTKKSAAKPAKTQTKQMARVEKDVQRLESILAGVKTSAKITAKSWKSVAGEADELAARIYTNVKSATTDKKIIRHAENLRTHTQNMKKEAFAGDYKKTRRSADRALSVAARLDEWAG